MAPQPLGGFVSLFPLHNCINDELPLLLRQQFHICDMFRNIISYFSRLCLFQQVVKHTAERHLTALQAAAMRTGIGHVREACFFTIPHLNILILLREIGIQRVRHRQPDNAQIVKL